MLLNVKNLTKAYSDTPVLKNVEFSIEDNDKIGIIGVNGTGKSTLLKIIAGVEPSDSGDFMYGKKCMINYLPQTPVFKEGYTILSYVMEGLKAEEHEAKTMLSKFKMTDYNKDPLTLSGGQQKRVALARALLLPCDLLLLDEPTNHLDSEMIQWLEKYLLKYNKAVLMITHDRYFLDRITTKLFEIDHGNLYIHNANYAKFLEIKATRQEMEISSYKKNRNILRRELAWMRAGAPARSTKAKDRIKRYYNLASYEAPVVQKQIDISTLASRLGHKTIEAYDLSKSFNNNILFKNFNYIVMRQDRLGILGPNGCGKSTLLNVLAGRLEADTGHVEIGETVKIGYFSQVPFDFPEDKRVLEYLESVGGYVETQNGELSAKELLETFLFDGNMQWTYIKHLSGGEKRRLYLLSILITQPNILFLDEPTNDLDIDTLSVLEDFLETFKGAVIVVSHDRYFLDRTVDHIFVYKDHEFVEHLGSYESYEIETTTKETTNTYTNTHEKKVKLSYKQQREYEQLSKEIPVIEEKLEAMKEFMNDHADNYNAVMEKTHEYNKLSEEYEEKLEIWMELAEIAENM